MKTTDEQAIKLNEEFEFYGHDTNYTTDELLVFETIEQTLEYFTNKETVERFNNHEDMEEYVDENFGVNVYYSSEQSIYFVLVL